MACKRKYTPPEWENGLNISTSSYRGIVQVDDVEQVFTGGGKYDKTGFFRYPEVYEEISARVLTGTGHKRLLSLPSSVGCEAYSLAAIFSKHAAPDQSLEIHMADISDAKLHAAQSGVYPYGFHNGVLSEYRDYFNDVGGVHMTVKPEIKSMVKALPAINIMDQPEMALRYDMVVSLNLLCYLPDRESKISAVQYLSTLTDGALCISHGTSAAFFADHDAVNDALNEAGFYEDKFFDGYKGYKNAQFYTPRGLE